MCANIVCLAAVLVGVDYRCQQLPDGGLQYVIQIEPEVLERLESGSIEAVESYVPPDLKDIRAYRIKIGTQGLAKDVPTANVRSPIFGGVETDWVPLPAGGVECRMWIKPEVLGELRKPGRAIEGKIAADVKMFTIAVGTKPPAASPAATSGNDPPEPVAAKADQAPATLTPGLPIAPPHVEEQPALGPSPPSIGPPPDRFPDTTAAPMVPNIVPSPPPSEAAPPGFSAEPPAFSPGAEVRPMPGQRTDYLEDPETAPNERPRTETDANWPAEEESVTEAPANPPLSPTVTLFGLFASLAGNVFLLWIMRDFRSRYRALLRRMGEVGDIVRSCVLELEKSG